MNETPLRLSDRARDIRPFQVMEILARARAMEAAGRSLIHMEIGEPDFPTPPPIVEAGIRALQAVNRSAVSEKEDRRLLSTIND